MHCYSAEALLSGFSHGLFRQRNTSATYLAMQMIIAAGLCLKYAGNVDFKRLLGSESALLSVVEAQEGPALILVSF